MDGSGAGGGAYLLQSNVSIRSGKRKRLLFIAKATRTLWRKLGECRSTPGSGAKAFRGDSIGIRRRGKTARENHGAGHRA